MTRAGAPPAPVEVLRDLCHAFASTTDPDEAVGATIGWVREALGGVPATICVVLPDAAGRLRLAAETGARVPGGRLRSARRRRVFETKRPLRVGLTDPAGRVLQIFPLVSRGESVGVVELITSEAALEERADVLEAVVGQAAAVLRNTRDRRESERALGGLGASVGLAAELLRADSPDRAVRLSADLCYEHLRIPLVCWAPSGAGNVVVVRGFGAAKRGEVRRAVTSLAELPPARAVEGVTRVLEPLLGAEPVVVRAGDARLVAAGGVGHAGRSLLETVGRLLADALRTIGVVTEARAKSDGLDLGIAWTAHELRGPLIGAVAAINHLVSMNGSGPSTQLLRRTRDELESLAGLVDPLLRWASGSKRLRKRETDLMRVVGEAITSCELSIDHQRVVLDGPEALKIRADPKQLRTAVANLVRNALASSPRDAAVMVEVGRSQEVAWVCVRDRGPGVPPGERELIFEPFGRGHAGARARGGAGLGLFIARRVVEAHGGTLGLLPTRKGAAFRLEVPVTRRRRASSAS